MYLHTLTGKKEENGTLCWSQFSNQIRREKPNNHAYDIPAATPIRPTDSRERDSRGERGQQTCSR